MPDNKLVRWGIVGPGAIARDFFAGAVGSRSGIIVAIGTRNPDAPGLADAFPGARIISGYEGLVSDPRVDAVYVSTPHPLHARWAMAAVEQGKHVLCEKPMGMTAAEVASMFDAARKAGVFLGEAYMYRFHPLMARIVELIRSGAVGDVRMIHSSFGFAAVRKGPQDRLFSPELGGGAILDVGGYPFTMAGLIAACKGGDRIVSPESFEATGHVGAYGVDEWSSAILRFEGGVIASLSCSISLQQDNVLHVMGTAGRLEVDDFWFGCGKTGGTNTIRLIRSDGTRALFPVQDGRNLYSFQFEAANQAICSGMKEFPPPGMNAADSLIAAQILDRWRAQVRSRTAGLAG